MVRVLITYMLMLSTSFVWASSNMSVTIKGVQAKSLYQYLSGSQIDAQGAAGHLYKRGKNVNCIYVNADMSDKAGQLISRDDIRRYSCSITFDKNGVAGSSKPI
jgi:hypothetical protein